MNMRRVSAMAALILLSATLVALCPACSKKTPEAKPAPAEKSPTSFLKTDSSTTPEQLKYLKSGEPFVSAIARQDYDTAYSLLSHYATDRMSLNQFVATADKAEFDRNEKDAMLKVSLVDFKALMGKVEEQFGTPEKPILLYVFSTEPNVLARKGVQNTDALDAMFAIGAMPDSVPTDIRRASLRGQIRTELSEEQLADQAKEMKMSVKELSDDPDFQPYFNIKLVMVEEEGTLKVGYFEFMPPSILD